MTRTHFGFATRQFATGPGCGLIDEWAQTMADLPHDRDGHLALAGQVDWETVEQALDYSI